MRSTSGRGESRQLRGMELCSHNNSPDKIQNRFPVGETSDLFHLRPRTVRGRFVRGGHDGCDVGRVARADRGRLRCSADQAQKPTDGRFGRRVGVPPTSAKPFVLTSVVRDWLFTTSMAGAWTNSTVSVSVSVTTTDSGEVPVPVAMLVKNPASKSGWVTV